MIRVIQVIRAEIHRGQGTKEDPHRMVCQYWSFDGTLLFEDDPCEDDTARAGGGAGE